MILFETTLRKPDILIYKTNIREPEDLIAISRTMVKESRITKWTVDQADCDHVLRIESTDLSSNEIIAMIGRAGFSCEELND